MEGTTPISMPYVDKDKKRNFTTSTLTLAQNFDTVTHDCELRLKTKDLQDAVAFKRNGVKMQYAGPMVDGEFHLQLAKIHTQMPRTAK